MWLASSMHLIYNAVHFFLLVHNSQTCSGMIVAIKPKKPNVKLTQPVKRSRVRIMSDSSEEDPRSPVKSDPKKTRVLPITPSPSSSQGLSANTCMSPKGLMSSQ